MTAAAVTRRFGGACQGLGELAMPLVALGVFLPHYEYHGANSQRHDDGSEPPGKYCNLDTIFILPLLRVFFFRYCMSSARVRCFTLQTHLCSPTFKRVSPFQIPRTLLSSSNNLGIRTMASVSKAGKGTKCVHRRSEPTCHADMRQNGVHLEYW